MRRGTRQRCARRSAHGPIRLRRCCNGQVPTCHRSRYERSGPRVCRPCGRRRLRVGGCSWRTDPWTRDISASSCVLGVPQCVQSVANAGGYRAQRSRQCDRDLRRSGLPTHCGMGQISGRDSCSRVGPDVRRASARSGPADRPAARLEVVGLSGRLIVTTCRARSYRLNMGSQPAQRPALVPGVTELKDDGTIRVGPGPRGVPPLRAALPEKSGDHHRHDSVSWRSRIAAE